MQTTEQSCSLLHKWSTELETKYDPGFLKKKRQKEEDKKAVIFLKEKVSESIWRQNYFLKYKVKGLNPETFEV